MTVKVKVADILVKVLNIIIVVGVVLSNIILVVEDCILTTVEGPKENYFYLNFKVNEIISKVVI